MPRITVNLLCFSCHIHVFTGRYCAKNILPVYCNYSAGRRFFAPTYCTNHNKILLWSAVWDYGLCTLKTCERGDIPVKYVMTQQWQLHQPCCRTETRLSVFYHTDHPRHHTNWLVGRLVFNDNFSTNRLYLCHRCMKYIVYGRGTR